MFTLEELKIIELWGDRLEEDEEPVLKRVKDYIVKMEAEKHRLQAQMSPEDFIKYYPELI